MVLSLETLLTSCQPLCAVNSVVTTCILIPPVYATYSKVAICIIYKKMKHGLDKKFNCIKL